MPDTKTLKRELAAVALFFGALLLFMALASRNPADPSWNRAGGRLERVANLVGVGGAYLSDALFTALGYASYLLPAALLLAAVLLVSGRAFLRARTAGPCFFLVVVFFSTLLGLASGDPRRLDGGSLGDVLGAGIERYIGRPGGILLCLFVLAGCLMLLTGLGPTRLARLTGEGARRLFAALGRLKERLAAAIHARFGGPVEEEEAAGDYEPDTLPSLPANRKRSSKIAEEAPEEEPLIVEREPRVVSRPKPPRPVQQSLPFVCAKEDYVFPSVDLLDPADEEQLSPDRANLMANAQIVERKLLDFKIEGKVVEIHPGPVITMYEFRPAPGIKVSRVANLADDLAMALSAYSVRIIAPIPGKDVIGIEIPNRQREMIRFREILEDENYRKARSITTIAVGKDTFGEPFFTDLRKMPHLLVAGATGTGKSVAINSIILSILYRATPEDVRMIMVDPKLLEFPVYEGIPHLLLPVVTHHKQAALALRWAVAEMERRYALLSDWGVRGIDGYNKMVEKLRKEQEGGGKSKKPSFLDDAAADEPSDLSGAEIPSDIEIPEPEDADAPPLEKLPYLVIIIDEFADLMMVAKKEVEESVCRLAQKARAAGIHLILATQRPSVDVITGLIKANFPSRIALKVTSSVDARTILDRHGAEGLLGNGDMLFLPPGTSMLTRLHGAFVSDEEVHRVVQALKKNGGPRYDESILIDPEEDEEDGYAAFGQGSSGDETYDKAVAVVAQTRRATISFLQRKLGVGYNKAAKLIERMEKEGIVGPQNGVKPREVLIDQIHVEG